MIGENQRLLKTGATALLRSTSGESSHSSLHTAMNTLSLEISGI